MSGLELCRKSNAPQTREVADGGGRHPSRRESVASSWTARSDKSTLSPQQCMEMSATNWYTLSMPFLVPMN